MKQLVEDFFKLKEYNTSIQKELLAGFTTFVTMAYIIFVNPQIMSLAVSYTHLRAHETQ